MSERNIASMMLFLPVNGENVFDIAVDQIKQAVSIAGYSDNAILHEIVAILNDTFIFESLYAFTFDEQWDRIKVYYVENKLKALMESSHWYLYEQVEWIIYAGTQTDRVRPTDSMAQISERIYNLLWTVKTEAETYIQETAKYFDRGSRYLPSPKKNP